jgi:hypothetical protein
LLEGLFKKDPDRRLGGSKEDANDIKRHPWFKNIDWDALLQKKLKAPYIPNLKSDIDISNFDPVYFNLIFD